MVTAHALRSLEGRHVCIALTDGTRLDDCQLVSAGRGHVSRAWLFANGTDTFVPITDIVEAWEQIGA